MLHVTTPQPLQITSVLQEKCLWARSVAVNIEFCGHLRFLSIRFVWIIWVEYATDNLSGQQLEFVSQASVDISAHGELRSKR
jgi:hypothetical protein